MLAFSDLPRKARAIGFQLPTEIGFLTAVRQM
jgi:hypothetical protein